ncbi:minichromosome maintenance protein 10 [Fusarium oxysporum f. sp. pisi HDV247]|uniref:Minichromosome maintenance protein 10 n=1 Tax=Fusarium oxysporum f. sp. pisi HDV247 TaxID=1080344 RepID=W9PQ10_FUSOX|nr:minichromosome maintenance protein 10 [Fusarium oxysporum f. sp. pisi HDV247]
MAPASPAKQGTEAQWPPRSPHEALLSTPRGRERYRQMMTSPSPSPSKRARNLPSMNLMAEIENDDDDEDEETLQLKLQEIQARLKLKKLQAAKSKKSEESVEKLHATTSELVISTQVPSRSRRATTPTREPLARQQNHVEVPASPVRRVQEPSVQTSPSRVLLGIDKGLKARDISLKRAPSYRDSQTSTEIGQTGYLRRSRSKTTGSGNSSFSSETRPMSFNERLVSARTDEAARAQRQKDIQKLRSNAFSISQDEVEQYKKKAIEIPDEPLKAPSFSREEIIGTTKPVGLQRSYTVPNVQAPEKKAPAPTSTALVRKKKSPHGEVSEEQAAGFEPYSSFHLSKRILPHGVLARHVSGKQVYTIKDILKVVKAPDFALPDVEQDIVMFGILAKKSEPRAHKPTQKNGKTEDRGKYMVMTLVDLEWELDLFLFNSGFTKYWKLTEGTVIAILNPTIMPPPPGRHDTGKFSLVINSDDDSIIEVGTSRDLGGCQSVKKDGDLCGVWINKKRTHHCEFHSNEALRKQRSTRMEVNGSSFGARKNNSREVIGWGAEKKKDASRKYDWETKTHWFASRSMSAADLIDGKDRTPNDRKERAEFLKRDLEAKEKEREMMKKLGQVGSAAGREYMRQAGSKAALPAAGTSTQPSSSAQASEEAYRPDAKSLGLLGKDSAIHLSPVKRKRPDSSQASSQAGSAISSGPTAFGWGSNLKDKLSKMKEGEKLRKDEQPPVRKKTRFVTDKGIREAGRESLGDELHGRQIMLDDDDDDLVIV